MNHELPGDRKSLTNLKLIEGMIEVAARHGYAATAVERVIAAAGVTRSTFYSHFRDKDQCFLAVLRLLGARLLDGAGDFAGGDDPSAQAIRAIFAFTAEDPSGARVLLVESLAGGPEALAIRQSTIAELCGGGSTAGAPGRQQVLAGGATRLLAVRLRAGEIVLSELEVEDLLAWHRTYGSCVVDHRGTPGSGRLSGVGPRSLPALASLGDLPATARRTTTRVRRSRAIAALVAEAYRGSYAEVSVADVVAAAGISRKAFYELFDDKAQVALEANERFFQAAMTAVAGEFFAASSWPERIWAAGAALLGFMALHPAEAHLAFVATHVIGEAAVELTYDRLAAFTLFLEEGYGYRPEAAGVPRITSEALMATMFELAFRELSERRSAAQLLAMLPELVYIVTAPYMGEEAATAFVEKKMRPKVCSRPTSGGCLVDLAPSTGEPG